MTKQQTTSRASYEAALQAFSVSAGAIAQANAALSADMAEIRAQHEAHIAGDVKVRDEAEAIILLYCAEHRDEVFDDKKTVNTAGCTLSLRMGQWRVSLAPDMTEDQAVSILLKKAPEFVRIKQELNERAIIAAREDVKLMKAVNAAGIALEREEKFSVKLREEKLAA